MLDVQTSYFTAAADFDARIAQLESAIGAPLPASPAAGPVAEVSNDIEKKKVLLIGGVAVGVILAFVSCC